MAIVISVGISELSDVSITAAPEEKQFTKAMANIQQQQHQPAPGVPSRLGGAPTLVQPFHDQRVRQGDSVTFTCLITGTPKPKVCYFV